MKYSPIDLRKLTSNPNLCHLHKPSEKYQFDSVFVYEQQNEGNLNCDLHEIFSTQYRCPEVYTANLKKCIVGPRAPKLPRYWLFLWEDHYLYNFINETAKKILKASGTLSLDGQTIEIDIKPFCSISSPCVWLYPFKNIDHLLRESLPSILTLQELEGIDWKNLHFYCQEATDAFINLLVSLGIRKENIIDIPGKYVEFDQLIIPCFSSFGHLHTPTRLYIKTADFIRDEVARSGDYPKKIFVSRAKATQRKILNEDILYDGLKARGFSIIEPGEFSFTKQIELFSQAEIVVGPHGMGIANAAFSNKLKFLLEIMNSDYIRNSYYRTAQLRNCKYGVYLCHALDAQFNNERKTSSDVIIDRIKFFNFLDSCLN